MSGNERKPDYTVKNFDILNKHAEEGVAREREITKARRAQTNWQNAKNISLVIIAIGLLAIMIGLGYRIAQKDVYVSSGFNHSQSGQSYEYYSDGTSGEVRQNRFLSNNDSSENLEKYPSEQIDNSKQNNNKIKNDTTASSKESIVSSLGDNDKTKSSIASSNDVANKADTKSAEDNKGLIEKSTEKISYIIDTLLPSSNNKDSDATSTDEFKSENGPKVDGSQSNNQNSDENKSDSVSQSKEQENNELNPFEKLYENVYGKKFESSNKGEKTVTDTGVIQIIKDSIHQVSPKIEVLYKGNSYGVYTTYYFKDTESESLVYPFKQQCWAFTPSKIVLTLDVKYYEGEIISWDEPQEPALEKAGLDENELDIFRQSCRFV